MITVLNKIVWSIATSLILISGIYFSFKLKFTQFNLKKMISSILKKTDGISPFSSLMLTLAGTIGVGSIAGIGIAIYYGGYGTIFWMWVFALISASNTFSETYLGILYKEYDFNGIYKGGPSYYIKNGLNKKKLAIVLSIIIILSYILGFLPIQANTIVKSLNEIVNINPYIIGLILVISSGFIIIGGIKKISEFSNKIVPIMTLLYMFVALLVIIKNINLIPNILIKIITDAFKFKPFFSGFLSSLIIGIQRGIFANESGLGISSIASSTTSFSDPRITSYVQTLGVYITTLLICTSTFFIITTSNYQLLNLNNINGIEIVQYAFNYHFGFIGNIIIFISILLFAFSTILTGYYYIESSVKFFNSKLSKLQLLLIKIITLIFLFFGCIANSKTLWDITDTLLGIMAIINIYALLKLKDKINN